MKDKIIYPFLDKGGKYSGWPVKPLGHIKNKQLYYLTPDGCVVVFAPEELALNLSIICLVSGAIDWLIEKYPIYNEDGKRTGRWNVEKAGEDLVCEALYQGFFSMSSFEQNI